MGNIRNAVQVLLFLIQINTILVVNGLSFEDFKYLNHIDLTTDQEKYIKILEEYVNKDGLIDITVNKDSTKTRGTVLFTSILYNHNRIVKLALDLGADMTINNVYGYDEFRLPWNSVEGAILRHVYNLKYHEAENEIYELIIAKCMEKFSPYGLHQIHFDSAADEWPKVQKYLETEPALIDRTIDVHSSLWPGMTPLLMAAKFLTKHTTKKLIDHGAKVNARDPQGNSALHYLVSPDQIYGYRLKYLGDERLFIFDEEDTFGSYNGLSHFHMAILPYSKNIDIIERYLKLGVPPTLKPRNNKIVRPSYSRAADTVYDLLAHREHDDAVKVLKLLLEYGADPDDISDNGHTVLDKYTSFNYLEIENSLLVKFVCPLLEIGLYSEFRSLRLFVHGLGVHNKLEFLACVKRMLMINQNLVKKKLHDAYDRVLEVSPTFNETSYGIDCKKELDQLHKRGLLRELDHTNIISIDFKQRFGSLVGSTDLPLIYPIYGEILKIKLRRRLIEFEQKKKKIHEAVPHMMILGNQICDDQNFNFDAAESVLWHFTYKELDQFMNSSDFESNTKLITQLTNNLKQLCVIL